MKANKEQVEQSAITAVITLIVATVGFAIFDMNVAVYSGITAGLSVAVGKEYGDSIVLESSWHWKDVIPGVCGVIVGLLVFELLYLLR